MKLITMEPGSVLYLPANWPHYVVGADEISISMNYSIETPTWRDVLLHAVNEILAEPQFDRAVELMPGQALATRDPVCRLLADRLASLDQTRLMQLLDDDFERTRLVAEKSIFTVSKKQSL